MVFPLIIVSLFFALKLWCEHSRKPVAVLDEEESRGVYKLERSREWLAGHGKALKTVTRTLSAILLVVAAITKLAIPEESYKSLEKNLNFGKELFGTVLKAGDVISDISGDTIISDEEHGQAQQAQNAVIREIHAWLKENDPGFGGLVRVQNKRREFLWVHPQFVNEY